MEEALANASALLAVQSARLPPCLSSSDRAFVKALLRDSYAYQPPGYRMCTHYQKRDDFRSGVRTLQSQIRTASVNPTIAADHWNPELDLMKPILDGKKMVYLVTRNSSTRFPCLASPGPVVESRKLKTHLARIGYTETSRGKGSHVVYQHEGRQKPSVTVPCGKTLTLGVAGRIAKVIGYSNVRELCEVIRGKQILH